MATCNYLPGILLLSFIGVYIGIGSNNIESQEPRTKNQEEYQVSGIKYQDRGASFGKVVSINTGNLFNDEVAAQTSDFRPPTSVTVLRKQVKTIYNSQVGVRETASNRGPQVEKYLRYVGLSKGNPWCAAFVCWVLGEAGVENPRSGWSPDLFPGRRIVWDREQRAKNKEQGRPQNVAPLINRLPNSLVSDKAKRLTDSPTTADVFGIYFPERKRIAHVGFVDVWDGSWLITVEGNTNTSGGRDGDGVYRKRRPVRSIYRVTRYIN